MSSIQNKSFKINYMTKLSPWSLSSSSPGVCSRDVMRMKIGWTSEEDILISHCQ